MMAALTPTKITLYARVNESDVLNEIAVLEQVVQFEAITDENRKPGDAVEAVARVVDFDLIGALRAAADRLERERTA